MFKLRPSSAKQWMTCPASFQRQAELEPETSSSPAAFEGTAAHALAETCLKTGTTARDISQMLVEGHNFQFPQESQDYVQGYVDYVMDFAKLEGATLLVEQQVQVPSKYLAKDVLLGGTLDASVQVGSQLYVLDLKFGRGVEVSAEENPQLMIYALAQLERLGKQGIRHVTMCIYQPRIAGLPYSTCKMSAADLRKWGMETLKPATQKVKAKKPKYGADEDACRFCRVKDACEEHALFFTRRLNLASRPLGLLTDAERVELFKAKKTIEHALKEVEESLLRDLNDGKHIAGVKRVKKSTQRAWADPEGMIKKYKSKVTKTVIITPAQAEKSIGKDAVAKNLLEKPTEFKVALEESKAQEFVGTASAEVFDVLS